MGSISHYDPFAFIYTSAIANITVTTIQAAAQAPFAYVVTRQNNPRKKTAKIQRPNTIAPNQNMMPARYSPRTAWRAGLRLFCSKHSVHRSNSLLDTAPGDACETATD